MALFALAGALQFSIAVAQILLTIAIICWVGAARRPPRAIRGAARSSGRCSPTRGMTLVSAAFSADPRASLIDSKQLVLFLIVPRRRIVSRPASARHHADHRGASAARGERRVRHRPVRHPALRPARPAAAGNARPLHDLFGAADARHRASRSRALLFGTSDRTWAALVLPALGVAVALTFTRSARGRRLRRRRRCCSR